MQQTMVVWKEAWLASKCFSRRRSSNKQMAADVVCCSGNSEIQLLEEVTTQLEAF